MSKPVLLTVVCSDEFEQLYRDHERLHNEYAERHGFYLLLERIPLTSDFCWQKQRIIRELMVKCPGEQIIYFDSDAFILKPSVDLRGSGGDAARGNYGRGVYRPAR